MCCTCLRDGVLRRFLVAFVLVDNAVSSCGGFVDAMVDWRGTNLLHVTMLQLSITACFILFVPLPSTNFQSVSLLEPPHRHSLPESDPESLG